MAKKKEFYKLVKIGGLVSFLPFVLAAGPLAGYIAGDFLKYKFHSGDYIFFICIIFGVAAGISEADRIIIAVIKLNKND